MQNFNLNLKILRGGIPILFFIAILIGWIASGYIFTDTTFIIGMLMLPYLIIIKSKNQTGWLYSILTKNLVSIKDKSIFTPLSILAILGISLGLNMFFNLLRIVLLVLFSWMPDTFMHDAAGVVGLGLYVFLPLYFIVKTGASLLNNSPFTFPINIFPKIVFQFKFINLFKYSFTILTLIWLTYISFYKIHNISPESTSNQLTINYLEQIHCPKTQSKDGILKYENDEILVYLKPIPGFYAAEHSPLICWQGSGYTFGQVKSMLINDIEIYTGVLKKREDTLQTAWWYDNGKTQTASQTAWRTAILKGEPNFNLVNITSIDTAKLYKNIQLILKNN